MAYQASRIAWGLLTSSLEWQTIDDGEGPDLRLKPGNLLRPRNRFIRDSDLDKFVNVFLGVLSEDTQSRGNKYSKPTSPGTDDIVLDDDVVRRISPTVQRLAPRLERCFGDKYRECHVTIPREEREASAFQRNAWVTMCGRFLDESGPDFYSLETFKILLLHGEMDAVLSICALPNSHVREWWKVPECPCAMQLWADGNPREVCSREPCNCDNKALLGWEQLFVASFLAYLALNLFLCLPETWHEDQELPGKTRHYRNTRIYQYMLRRCTASGFTSDIPGYPHREFFGIAEGQFNRLPVIRGTVMAEHVGVVYGLVPVSKFLVCEGPVDYMPSPHDVHDVWLALQSLGLPTELVLKVVDLAAYYPRRRLEVPHDPLHPRNRTQLDGYMDYCWDLLVHCDMAKGARHMWAWWEPLVVRAIADLFGMKEDGQTE